jgi:hypothetical protein
MTTYTLSEACKNLTTVLDMAENDGAVIEREDGRRFQVMPVGKKVAQSESPFETIKGLGRSDIPLEVILETIREGRARV